MLTCFRCKKEFEAYEDVNSDVKPETVKVLCRECYAKRIEWMYGGIREGRSNQTKRKPQSSRGRK